jgi:hypothetical protein
MVLALAVQNEVRWKWLSWSWQSSFLAPVAIPGWCGLFSSVVICC